MESDQGLIWRHARGARIKEVHSEIELGEEEKADELERMKYKKKR